MRRSRQQSAFTNPVLVGAVTVLAIMVAVFLAYNANAGLPFVPTKQLKVDIGDGSNLVVGNDVREGGFRIGLVSAMKPIELRQRPGRGAADAPARQGERERAEGLARDRSCRARCSGSSTSRSTRGTSKQTFPDGGTLPIGQTSVPVQFDDIFKTFDPKTRTAIQNSLVGVGDTLTGRGSSLNDTIHSLPELLLHLQPVAQYLADPNTELTRFFNSLNAFMGAVVAGRAGQCAPVHRRGDDVRGDLARPEGARVDDRRVALDARRLDQQPDRPAAVPRRPDRARDEADAGHG